MSATPRGDLPRNEGRRNFPYGPRPGARKSGLALGSNTPDKYGASRLRGLVSVPDVVLEELTRTDLRKLAKSRGFKGYGSLNKAGLIGLLS